MKWSDSGGGSFKQPPAGTHQARCIGLVDLGTQRNEYQGVTNLRRQVLVTWELPGELMDTGKPYIVSKFYTQSLNEKSRLYADLVNWRGREFSPEELAGFDAKSILDKPCLLSVTMNDAGKARVTGLMKQPKHMEPPPRVNEITYFSLEPGEFNRETFDRLGEGIQRIIRLSPEWAELQNPGAGKQREPGQDLDDDIPF
jgi:hypothetical protein